MISEYKIIEILSDKDIPGALIDLYCEAFPEAERRKWTNTHDIAVFMGAHPDMHIKIITSAEKFAGFMIYWYITPDICYVEHLATQPDLRGCGLGARLIESLTKCSGMGIILEVEPPSDQLTRRRVGFYKRLGLIIHDNVEYIQPPYSSELPSLKLSLMTTPDISDKDLVNRLIGLLYEKIYGVN